MSLVKTLTKLAVGYAVARGVKSVVGGGGGTKTAGGGSIFGRSTSDRTRGSSTGLEGIMDGLLNGAGRSTAGGTTSGGGLGDILGQLGGAAVGRKSGGSLGGLGDRLNQSLGQGGQLQTTPSDDEEDAAGLLIRAMLQAAKADGRVDEEEKQKLLQNVGDLSREESDFINAELNRGIDVAGLAREVPNGMQGQVYMMSLMAIDLDNQNEAQYLNDLALEMRMNQTQVNQIHDMLGVQPLYA